MKTRQKSEQVLAKEAEYRAKNRAKASEAAKRWALENPDKWKVLRRKYLDKAAAEISDCYLVALMKVPSALVTPELLEAKRQHVRVKRLLKERAK